MGLLGNVFSKLLPINGYLCLLNAKSIGPVDVNSRMSLESIPISSFHTPALANLANRVFWKLLEPSGMQEASNVLSTFILSITFLLFTQKVCFKP